MLQKWKWDPALTDFEPKGPKFVDRTEDLYGTLTCLYPTRRSRRDVFWMCRCVCGQEVEVSAAKLYGKVTTSCGCRRLGETNPRWSGCGEITGHFLKNLKSNAKVRGIEVRMTAKEMWDLFLEQDRVCALSGTPLTFKGKTATDTTASLDRIDNAKGYVRGNVQWVHKFINTMKTDLPLEKFIQICTEVSDHFFTESSRRRRSVRGRQ